MDGRYRPFQSDPGAEDSAPVLLTCEHASYAIPPGYGGLGHDPRWLRDHFGWDPGAAGLQTELAHRLRAPWVRSCFSRLFIDANRPPEHPFCIREAIEGDDLPGNHKLSDEERARRLEHHAAYHQAIAEACQAFLLRRKRFQLLSLHSFTPVLGALDRRDIDVGILHDEANTADAERLRDALVELGQRCRLNEPYSGMDGLCYAVATPGQRFRQPYLLLEVRSDLLLSAAQRRRMAETLEKALAPLLHDLRASEGPP